ncbi:MAG: LysM peptidoglycan-binding domain-containing protein [Burkholderiales bacterium]|nr:LysM peptidoglycan-binding domain-containing protein [Burkholderiales bacterium]MDE2288347.1 LysM peptidoglycan-binding domain-containing protein [Burkholderiales bacterium]MDE2609858.1 LysM peptidoglycan-binding domain-containing protein [Burkholderiales bacterium]
MVKQLDALRMTALAALLWGAGLLSANAMTLGNQTVRSGAGQPLQADIQVTDVTPVEANGLSVSLAPREVFNLTGVNYASALTDLKLGLTKAGPGHYVIHVSTSQPVASPFLDLVIVLDWRSGRQTSPYTLLINQSAEQTRGRGATIVAPSTAPSGAGATTQGAPSSAASTGQAGKRYVVERGDTLSDLAAKFASEVPGVTSAQMMAALYNANRGAFIGGNSNLLKAGAALQLPSDGTVQAVSPQAASRFVAESRAQFQAYRARLAESAAKQHTQAAGRSAGGTIEKQAPATAPTAPGDELTLSRPEQGPKAGNTPEDRIAREKAIDEAKGRVQALEKNVGELQKLLALKKKQAGEQAAAQSGASAPAAGVAAASTAVASQPAASQSTAVPAAASQAPASVVAAGEKKGAPALSWDALKRNPYLWPGAALLVLLLAILWFMTRRRAQPQAPVGQEGPYDAGGDDSHAAHADAVANGDAHKTMNERITQRMEKVSSEKNVALAAGALSAEAALERLVAETEKAPRPTPSSMPVNGVAQLVGDIDLSLPGHADESVRTEAHTDKPIVSPDEAPWGTVNFTMAPAGEAAGAASSPVSPDDAQALRDEPATPFAVPERDEAPSLKPLSFDLSGFDLDLKGASEADTAQAGPAHAPLADTIQTKLELANAYVAIGDKAGARELLEEVLRDGDAAAQAEARKRMATLG